MRSLSSKLKICVLLLVAVLWLQACSQDATAETPPAPVVEEPRPATDAGPSLTTETGPVPSDAEPMSATESDGGLSTDGAVSADADPLFSELDGSVSTSIGGPSAGQVKGAIPFPKQGPGVRLNPRRLNKGGHYATYETIERIMDAAAVVEREHPGGFPLIVNDLGFREGGPIPHHGSHQAGRDLDVLFYLLDREGEPRAAKGVPLDTRGRGWDFNDLAVPDDDLFVKIDPVRTWRFLQALAEREDTLVQRVFVAEHLRTILLREARRVKAPRAVRRRVEEFTCQPGTPHDDHFHIRFFCTADDILDGCEDSAPIYPWRREQLRELEVRPVISRPWRNRRKRRRSKTVSRAQARAKAGKMHWKVISFLKLRESWSEQPHPGRPYCR